MATPKEVILAIVRQMPDDATRVEAVQNAETVMTLWLETARELGRPIP